jgi:ribosome-binding protein aMBF1 (putative translation factor)
MIVWLTSSYTRKIVAWMLSLDDADWDRTVVIIDRLAVVGPAARMPLSRSLGDGLFEVRFTLASTARRITSDSRAMAASCCSPRFGSSAGTNAPRSPEPGKPPRTALAGTHEGGDNDGQLLRWEDVKKSRGGPRPQVRAGIEQDLALGQLIYDLRTAAGLSQRALAERMGTTQSVISRLEEGGGAKSRLDTLARVATALNRHLIVSFPEKVPARLTDGVQVA